MRLTAAGPLAGATVAAASLVLGAIALKPAPAPRTHGRSVALAVQGLG